MKPSTIAFIGGGNMARSLIGGLIADGCATERLIAADPDEGQRRLLADGFGIRTCADNRDALAASDVLVLAVKPQIMESVATELAPGFPRAAGPDAPGRLVISIAAGVRTTALAAWLGPGAAVVRAMPNTPALVQSGATVLYAGTGVQDDQRETAETILRAVGITQWIDDEGLMDAVTALSGSGPAYFFMVMEAMEAAGCRMGMSPEMARLLTIQTAFGAAKMALESTDSGPGELRRQVTSPGGTTERALEVLRAGDLQGLFERALAAARDRSMELSSLLGKGRNDG